MPGRVAVARAMGYWLLLLSLFLPHSFVGAAFHATAPPASLFLVGRLDASRRQQQRQCLVALRGANDDDDGKNTNNNNGDEKEWTSDFDDYVGDGGGGGGSNDGKASNEWTSDFSDFIGDKSSSIGDSNDNDNGKVIEEVGGEKTTDDDDDRPDDTTEDLTRQFRERVKTTATGKAAPDWTAISSRQFSLGQDLVLSSYTGSMGFEEVTDWEYYYQDEEEGDDPTGRGRQVVQPNPFDSAQPKRTRMSSGSVVRLFRGEFTGALGGMLRSQGLDNRIIVKEFSGKLALALAKAEMQSIGKLQSDLLLSQQRGGKNDVSAAAASAGEWIEAAYARSTGATARKDHRHVTDLSGLLVGKAPFLGIFGEVNLAELLEEEDDSSSLEPNEFYRALGVPPPTAGAVWIVYEYASLASSVQALSVPAALRRARLPPKKGFFGTVIVDPPPLPSWADRAAYIVKGVMKKTIEAVAAMHESGIVHRSIGRSSILLTSSKQDKQEVVSPFATPAMISQLRVKLADFGFSGLLYADDSGDGKGSFEESASSMQLLQDKEFVSRARSFGLFLDGKRSRTTNAALQATNFAIAEDMYATGVVFLGLLLSALAEVDGALLLAAVQPGGAQQQLEEQMQQLVPATDEDTLNRLFSDIFDKDMEQFRDYVQAEEVWSNVVQLLDANDEAGWKVLETLLVAREKVKDTPSTSSIFSIRGILPSPFFQ